MKNDFLVKLFSELEYLNTVPKFQLERAVSPLLGIFIKEIINSQFNVRTTISIPEFPLKKMDNNQSTNIDWLLIDVINKSLFLIELKTDILSLSDEQSTIYKSVIDKLSSVQNASFLQEDITKILRASKRKDKYHTITDKLSTDEINLSDYNKIEVIYLVPNEIGPYKNYSFAKIFLFSGLPENIATEYYSEWQLLRNFLKSLSKTNEKK
jgi:hypothetical protein